MAGTTHGLLLCIVVGVANAARYINGYNPIYDDPQRLRYLCRNPYNQNIGLPFLCNYYNGLINTPIYSNEYNNIPGEYARFSDNADESLPQDDFTPKLPPIEDMDPKNPENSVPVVIAYGEESGNDQNPDITGNTLVILPTLVDPTNAFDSEPVSNDNKEQAYSVIQLSNGVSILVPSKNGHSIVSHTRRVVIVSKGDIGSEEEEADKIHISQQHGPSSDQNEDKPKTDENEDDKKEIPHKDELNKVNPLQISEPKTNGPPVVTDNESAAEEMQDEKKSPPKVNEQNLFTNEKQIVSKDKDSETDVEEKKKEE